MRTIGLIGGMSWESTVTYYQCINKTINEKLGGLHSAKCLLYSVDFAEVEVCQAKGEWEKSGDILSDAAVHLEKAGADFILICTNTMHKVADQVQARISIPIMHIADATADELEKHGVMRAALLGTRYTMTQDFYRSKLIGRGIEVLLPEEKDMDLINSVIFGELCRGIVSEASKAEFLRIINGLSMRGAQGIILGCTELGMLIRQADVTVPLFDTAVIHAQKAALLSIEP
jgi:aspartate racemase